MIALYGAIITLLLLALALILLIVAIIAAATENLRRVRRLNPKDRERLKQLKEMVTTIKKWKKHLPLTKPKSIDFRNPMIYYQDEISAKIQLNDSFEGERIIIHICVRMAFKNWNIYALAYSSSDGSCIWKHVKGKHPLYDKLNTLEHKEDATPNDVLNILEDHYL